MVKIKWELVLLWLLIGIYTAVFSYLTIQRHNAFASNYDLANMDQTVWNTLNGRWFALSGASETISRLAIHADFILILLAPFYLIWNDVRMLLIIQSAGLALGAVPVYLLGLKILKNRIAGLAMVVVYLLNPGMQWTNIYDFHGVALAIPLLLAAFYCAYTKNWKWFVIFALFAFSTKEEIPLFLAMLGIIIYIVFKERKIGFITFFTGGLWFPLMVRAVIPRFSESGKYWAMGWYSLTPTITGLINKFFLANDAVGYYLALLKPFGFLPLLGFPWLIMALPELTINMLSSQGQMRSTVFHYDSGITPALVIASIFGLNYLEKGIRYFKPISGLANPAKWAAIFGLVLVALRVNYHYSPLPTTPACWCYVYQVSDEDRRFEQLLKTIPGRASITASGNVRPHLSHRENAFTLPNATSSAQYIAILTEQRIVGDYRPIDENIVAAMRSSEEHELVEQIGKFYLFKRIE